MVGRILNALKILSSWNMFPECRWTVNMIEYLSYNCCCYCSSITKLCPTLCNAMTAACQAFLTITVSWRLPKFMSIELPMPSNHLIPCLPLLLPLSIFPSSRIFSSESVAHISLPKYWNFSFSISRSNEYSGLISFRMDWLNLFAVQGTQESSPTSQIKSIKSLALSLLYGSTLTSVNDCWKDHSLTIQTFVGKVMFLLSDMLPRFVIMFLSRSKRLLISWLMSPSTVILEPQKRKSVTASTFPPSICHKVMGLDAMT